MFKVVKCFLNTDILLNIQFVIIYNLKKNRNIERENLVKR